MMTTYASNLERLKELNNEYAKIERQIHAEMKRVFVPGGIVTWLHNGRYRQYGTVIEVGHNHNILVENNHTGSERWLTLFDLLQGEEEDKP